MKKIFNFILCISFFVFFWNNLYAITNSAFNSSPSFDVGNFMSNNYYRWRCDANSNQCIKTQTKTENDFGTESECKKDCNKNSSNSFTTSNNFYSQPINNLSYQTTSTTKLTYSSSNTFNFGTNLQLNSVSTTKPTYTSQNISGLSGFNLFTATTKLITPNNGTINNQPLISGFNLDSNQYLNNIPPVKLNNNPITSFLETLGIIKTNALHGTEDLPLSMPKDDPEEEIKPQGFNPLTDYCDVKFESFDFKTEIEKIAFLAKLSKCTDERYPIFFSIKYINNKGISQELFNKEHARDGHFNQEFIMPEDIKIVDNKTKITFNVYQCRPNENWNRLLGADPDCLDDIKNKNTNHYKHDSYEKEFTDVNGMSMGNNCSYEIVSPVKNKVYVEGDDTSLPIIVNIDCPDGKGGHEWREINVNYKFKCQNKKGISQYYYPDYNTNTTIDYRGNQDYTLGSFNLGPKFYGYSDMDTCIIDFTLNDELGNHKEISAKFKLQSCLLDLKNFDNYKTNFYLDDPYIPFLMYTRCNNFDENNVRIGVECINEMTEKAELMRGVAVGTYESRIVLKKSSRDFAVAVYNVPTHLIYENKNWENLTCTVRFLNNDAEDYHSFLDNGAKQAKITVYNTKRPEEEKPFPSILIPGDATSTTKKGGSDASPRPNVINIIVDFFKGLFK